jgi:hypothetical protein
MGVPSSQVFTLVLDADRGIAIVGANGGATSQPAEVSGNSFRVRGSLGISAGSCSASVTYIDPTFVVGAGGQLTGSSTGRASWSVTDIGYSAPTSMSLTGVNDTQPPVLTVSSTSSDLTDPFTSISLVASEPLPPDARARLIGSAGGEVVLSSPNTEFFAVQLSKSKLLRYGEQYHLSVDGITDFAGNAASPVSVQFTTAAAPPLVAEDGFESTTGAMLGGAQILAGTGEPVLTGARSLYIPASGGGAPSGPRPQRTQLVLRLAVTPGDTVVRFAYRTVNPSTVSTGTIIFVAVPGGGGAAQNVTSAPTPTTAATVAGQAVSLGPPAMAEIPLPADASSEIVIARIAYGTGCSGLPPPPIEGMIIDDLRVE